MVTLSRRSALLGLAAAFSFGRSSLAVAQIKIENRLVVVNLRGALDGIATVIPYGDPAYADLRGPIALAPGAPEGPLDLGGFYGLNPALPNLHGMYVAGELLPIHAVAGPYRERSHFVAQDYLESGANQRLASGWLNRVLQAIPTPPGLPPEREGVAIGGPTPLLMRGPAPVSNWAPGGMPTAESSLYAAIAALSKTDPVIGPAVMVGLSSRGFSAAILNGMEPDRSLGQFGTLAKTAGELLRAKDGPRIASMDINGWDTHAAQAHRLTPLLRQLDTGLSALKTALGPIWRQTVVLVMTEFGRTAKMNGTGGTDHGTATVAFVVGGAVAGGRVAGTWPGLAQDKLLDRRDLAPTTDLRSVSKAILAQHLGLDRRVIGQVFPGSEAVEPMSGVIRT